MSNVTRPHHGTGIIVAVPGLGTLQAYGPTVPADGSSGYAIGCIFHHIDGGNDTAVYINEGTAASSDFNALTPS